MIMGGFLRQCIMGTYVRLIGLGRLANDFCREKQETIFLHYWEHVQQFVGEGRDNLVPNNTSN